MTGSSYGQALLLSTVAGLSTLIGAALPFCIPYLEIKYLVFSLSFAGGVMVYISVITMMPESLNYFKESDFFMNPVLAQSLFFFVGIFICIGLDKLVHHISGDHVQFDISDNMVDTMKEKKLDTKRKLNKKKIEDICSTSSSSPSIGLVSFDSQQENTILNGEHLITDDISTKSIEKIKKSKNKSSINNMNDHELQDNTILTEKNSQAQLSEKNITVVEDETNEIKINIADHQNDRKKDKIGMSKREKEELNRLGVLIALAISIHNIPEGIVTFSSSLSDTSIGIMLTTALAIHNIPEGLSVAFPIYYSTGSRRKAFIWGSFSGLAEPIAAFILYIILKICGIENTDFTPTTYGIIFSAIAGIMSYISLFELLPTAQKYDKQGSGDSKKESNLSNIGFILGMAVMAVSIVLLDVF